MPVGPNTPVSHNLTAAAATAGSWACPVMTHLITVTNEGTAAAYVTVDGTVPTVNGDDQHFIPQGGFVEIPITIVEGNTSPPTVQGISSAALSLWIEVDQ